MIRREIMKDTYLRATDTKFLSGKIEEGTCFAGNSTSPLAFGRVWDSPLLEKYSRDTAEEDKAI